MSNPNDNARNRALMGTALLEAREQFGPIFDSADGIRAEMEGRGWSPAAAEKVALTWLMGMLGQAFTTQAPR